METSKTKIKSKGKQKMETQKNITQKLVLILCFLFISSQSYSQLFIDNFEYPDGVSLFLNGWVTYGGAGPRIFVNSPGLIFSDYLGSGIGNAVKIDSTGVWHQNRFTSVQSSGSIYSSFMINLSLVRPVPPVDNSFFYLGTPYFSHLNARPAAGGYNLGIQKNANEGIQGVVYASPVYTLGITYLVVVKYTFAISDEMSLFVFAPGDSVPVIEPTPTLGPISFPLAADPIELRDVHLKQGYYHFYSPTLTIDGIYINTIWNLSPKNLHLTALIEGFYDDAADKMIRDTARVYLRNINSPYSVIDSSKSVLDSNGNGVFTFTNSAENGTPYYIVVKHRNSIETWSSGGNSFSSNNLTYNFTTAASQAYGDNLILKGSRYCIQSGDCNQDGLIDLTDQSMIENTIYNLPTGYVPTDINGDLIVDITDAIIADNSALRFASLQSPLQDQLSQNMPSQSKEKTSSKNSNNSFKLNDNYPNPFNPSTIISYQMLTSSDVSLKVYDMAGKEVASLVNQIQNAGKYSVTFNATGLSSGIYFYKLAVGNHTEVKKMTLIK